MKQLKVAMKHGKSQWNVYIRRLVWVLVELLYIEHQLVIFIYTYIEYTVHTHTYTVYLLLYMTVCGVSIPAVGV